MFKGRIDKGTHVKAVLSLNHNAAAPALLFIGQGSASDSDAVAPGATGTVSISADERGVLRVLVDVSSESDGGKLEVTPVTAEEDITGDTTWGYIVS